MPLNRPLWLALMVWIGLAGLARADEIRAFVYGNSLINHVSGSDETTMPHWLNRLAQAGGHGLTLDGVFGSGPEFAADLPPEPGWSFAEVPSAWGSAAMGFRRAGINTVILNPRNFIQDVAPDAPYAWDNPQGASPVSTTLRVFDWTAYQAPGARFFIYDGWPDMGLIAEAFPPSAPDLARYHEYAGGTYSDWFEAYVQMLRDARPDMDIRRIATAPILAGLLTQTALADLPATALYSDNAPHGTPTLYFLAALISYAAIYNEPPPVLELPDTIDPAVAANYPAIAGRIWSELSGSALPDHASLAPETGVADPALAMGLNGLADWSTQLPFIDLMRAARPWVGHLPGQWGGMEAAEMEAGGYLDENGWPREMPPGIAALESFVLTDLPASATGTAGRYRVTWRGQGRLVIGGRATDLRMGRGQGWFSFTPGDGPVALRIEATDPADPIRDIAVIRADQIPLFELGEVFNPDWIARVRDLRGIRFMDWMQTNGSPQRVWQDRPRLADYTWVRRGVPVEIMVRLANEIGADPWFTLPAMADDAYYRAFAEYVEARLDPDLVAYVEWSNEVWNFLFPQAAWAAEQAVRRWGGAQGNGWMQYAGLRAAEMADIWADVFAGQEDRLIRVVATQTSWPGLEAALLQAPLAQAEGRAAPAQSFDAYAVAGYFGNEIGSEENAARLRGWIAQGVATARVTDALRAGSLAEFLEDFLPYQAEVAARAGLRLVMYEGGTHIVGQGRVIEDETLTGFFAAYNYSPEMAGLYADLLAGWRAGGGTLFNAFVDVGAPSVWGSWGALRSLDDNNPRWATLEAYNATAGAGWEARAPGAFAQGVYRFGTDADDRLEGTDQEDVFVAGRGNDTLILGPGDRAHGGPGRDRALLPGRAADYALVEDGILRILNGPGAPIRLVSVEEAAFSDEPGSLYALEVVQE